MALSKMEHDGARLEQFEVGFLIRGNLPERLKGAMGALLHRTEGDQANLIRLTQFFKRPAQGHVTRQPLAAIGRLFKSGDGWNHWNAL